MKKQTLAVAVALVISLVAAGQSIARPRVLSTYIPFQFEVGSTKLPAGQYEIESVTTGNGTIQMIRKADGSASARFSTMVTEPRDGNSSPELVFHKYGNEYFLSEIRTGDNHSLQLFESRQERESARNQSAVIYALAVR
jgi:hypothetical protein